MSNPHDPAVPPPRQPAAEEALIRAALTPEINHRLRSARIVARRAVIVAEAGDLSQTDRDALETAITAALMPLAEIDEVRIALTGERRRRRLIAVENVAQGLLDQVLVHAREVFAIAIAKRASAIILAHNHPSGDPTPSEADIRVTRDLIRAGQLLKIEVLDHIILGQRTTERPRDYCSLRELGYFFSG
jgi:DNA repair protein RadC